MRAYTGKGDQGFTTLVNGRKVRKSDMVLGLLGSIDELNAFIGFLISLLENGDYKNDLRNLQERLSKIMGVIARVQKDRELDFSMENSLAWLEEKIGELERDLDNPQSFTFPGESSSGAAMDICRTVSRRVERSAVAYHDETGLLNISILAFLNRLSSYFYIMRLQADRT